MSITATQKIIKVGTSLAVTIPAKEAKRLGLKQGDEIEYTARKKAAQASDEAIIQTAKSVLHRYDKDFKNLAKR